MLQGAGEFRRAFRRRARRVVVRECVVHEDDLDALVALAHLQPDTPAFEPWLCDQLSRPPAEAGVTLASVHAVEVVSGPTSSSTTCRRRRVFHVAVTRSSIDTTVVPGAKPPPLLAELRAPGAPPAMQQRPATGRGRSRAAAAPTKTAPGDDLDADQRALDEVLRAWRTGVIRGTNKPAYTVLTDATLAQIAVVCPDDERALSRVPGIGPSKLEQYGDEVLATVQAHGAGE